MVGKEKLKGIGGWLIFFIITLVIISPIAALYYSFSGYYVIDGVFDWGLILIQIGLAIWGIVVGILLWTKKSQAVIRTKEYLLSYLCLNIFFVIFALFLGGYSSDSNLLVSDSMAALRTIIYFSIWFSYLNMSKRVKNTFKERKLKTKRVLLTILITIVAAFLLIFVFSPYYFETETIGVDFIPETESLAAGYLQYHEFTDQSSIQDISVEFESSGGPIEVYVVRSEEEFDKFIAGEDIDVYQGCYKKNSFSGIINCEVQSGGVIVYNPNDQEIIYTLELN